MATQGVELQQVYLCELQAAGLEASPPIMLELLFVCNSTLPAFPIWDQSNRERERESSKGMGLGVAVNSTQPRTGASRAILGLMGKGKGGIFHGPNKKSLNTRIGAATAICVDFGTLCETHEHEEKRSRNPAPYWLSCSRKLSTIFREAIEKGRSLAQLATRLHPVASNSPALFHVLRHVFVLDLQERL